MSAKLKAEGHKIVATMNRYGYSVSKEEWGHFASIVTARTDFSRWYILKGDQPLGVRSSRYCIGIKGSNLEISDYRKSGKATVTRYKFDAAEAKESCKKIYDGKSRCEEHYGLLARLEENLGERIALQGQVDGAALMTIVADPNSNTAEEHGDRDYRQVVTNTDGAALISASGEAFAFSDPVLTAFAKR